MRSFVARKQPQLNLEELLHFRWLLGGALALLSIWTLFYLEASIWPAALPATALISICLLRPTLPGVIPPWLWRLGVPVIAILFGIDVMLHEMIPAFVRLNVLLVLHRAMSYRTRREDLQLAALCLFLVIITGVLTVSLVFAFQILLFTAIALVFLFVVNIVHAATGDEPVAPATWTGLSRRRLAKRLWSVFDLRLLGLGAGLFLSVITIAAVIFLSIPRFQMESALNFLQFNRQRSLTGFSEQIALGEVTRISQDDSMAMRVDVAGDVTPAVPYWRMVVLDAYDHGIFSVSRAVTAHVGVRSTPTIEYTPPWAIRPNSETPAISLDPAVRLAATRPTARFTVFLESGVSRLLPLPGSYRELRFTEMQDVIENEYFETLQTQRQSATMLSYQIDGVDFSGVIEDPLFATMRPLPAPGDRSPIATVDERSRLRFLDYPATTLAVSVPATNHEYLRAVVAEITGGATLPAEEFARRACSWLAKHHRYSLSVELPPSSAADDPVIRWLRADAPGHCEFFAAAFVLLSRAAGHPTRAITGFKGGTWNAYENYYMVRNSDAHAWCEIFDGAAAWLRVDPTPGTSNVSTLTDPIVVGAVTTDDSVRAYIDSLRMVWYRRIVNFDQGSQRQVAGSLRELSAQIGRWSRALVATLWGEFRDWTRRPWTPNTAGDLFFYAFSLLLITGLMRYFGIGTSDLFAWLRSGEQPTRRRAGDLLQRIRVKLAEPPRTRFDPETARAIEAQLCLIRFGRVDHWPPPLAVFRAARRLL